MADALHDRWMPRSNVSMRRERASREAEQQREAVAQASRSARRKALPGYDGDSPEGMQGALRLR